MCNLTVKPTILLYNKTTTVMAINATKGKGFCFEVSFG